MGEGALAELQAELAALAELEAGLKARERDLLAELAGHIEKPPAKLETEYTGLVARLRALPLRRAQLQAQVTAITRAGHLAELEAMHAEHYRRTKELADFDRTVKQAQEDLAALVKQRAAMSAETERLWVRQSSKARDMQAAGELTSTEAAELNSRYSYLDPSYPRYSHVMRRRAERGHLPPGMTLDDFGIEPEPAEGEA